MPNCPDHPTIALEAKKQGWYCEACDRTVMSYDAFPRETTPALQGLAERGPTVLAAPLTQYLAEDDPTRPTKYAVRGFDDEIARDASPGRFVGRTHEVATLGAEVRACHQGVLWVWGPAGIGKSFVLAKVTTAAAEEAAGTTTTVLAWRFQSGDDRCRGETFADFVIERLHPEAAAPQASKKYDALEAALRHAAAKGRVVLVLDGLDEVAERDPAFAREVPLALRLPNVLWVCGGRPERGLPEAFAEGGAIEPFPTGLPRMSDDDVRAMLVEKLGPLRRKLLRGDRDDDGRVTNAFVELVTRNARGLPIYVKCVIEDVLCGDLSPEPGAALPFGGARFVIHLRRSA
jgi:hypothetical protein